MIPVVVNQHFYYRKERGGGGQRVMIGIIIEENVYNYGRPLTHIYLYVYFVISLSGWGACF